MTDDGFNWLNDSQRKPQQHSGVYRRVLVVNAPDATTADTVMRGNPLSALSDLRLLAEDKSFINGFLGALSLPDDLAHGLLCEYRARWEKAAQRCTNPNGRSNAGRRAGNIWLQQGARGFINWMQVDKPPP